ncbi:MAG TPA: chemotaxis protein CheB, partial [Myxococcaceae bacterium]|nr:chemotaxis protein CheB [Myxococcaceae bacterium]
MIRVLVVDDSETFRAHLIHILEAEPQIAVIGCASTGHQAFEMVARLRPDVVTMEALMPDLDGVEATKLILRCFRVPIIIVSAEAAGHVGVRALGAGAVEALAKPTSAADGERFRRQLLRSVKLLSEVPITLRRDLAEPSASQPREATSSRAARSEVKVIAIGASTGGPGVISALFQALPVDFRPAMVIAQHISEGFDRFMVDWWTQAARRPVELARPGRQLAPGAAVMAPANQHLLVTRRGDLQLRKREPSDQFVPSIDRLFHSVADAFGPAAIGLLLSGMGEDGAAGLLAMRSARAITAVQEPSSAVIGSMPEHALAIGAAT